MNKGFTSLVQSILSDWARTGFLREKHTEKNLQEMPENRGSSW